MLLVVTLVLTRGLPGSGKTTLAYEWVAKLAPAGDVRPRVLTSPRTGELPARARVNRDDLRRMMFGGWTGLAEHENAVTLAQHTAVEALLRAGVDVVADDTNLHESTMTAWQRLAAEVGAEIEVWDLTDVPVDECVRRNELRIGTAAYVPPEVIEDMWARHVRQAA